MSSKKTTIRLKDYALEYLDKLKETKGVSYTQVIHELILICIKENYKFLKDENIKNIETNYKEIRIFINKDEYEALENFRKIHGFNSITKEAKYLILSSLKDEKYINKNQFNELMKAIIEIKKIGVNINQIAKVLNEKRFDNFSPDMQKFNKIVEDTSNEIKLTIKQIVSDYMALTKRLNG